MAIATTLSTARMADGSSPMEAGASGAHEMENGGGGKRSERESNKLVGVEAAHERPDRSYFRDAAKRSRDMKKQYLHELEAICERKCDEVKQLATCVAVARGLP